MNDGKSDGEGQDEKRAQVDALRAIQRRLGLASQEEMAREIGVNAGTLSRALNERQPSLMLPETRLKVARFLGRRCASEGELEALEQETGWRLSARERQEARGYLRRSSNSPLHGVPWRIEWRFAGREQAVAELEERLLDSGRRLVVLQGLPGVGKTMLAAQVLRSEPVQQRFQSGVYWLALDNLGEEGAILELVRWVLQRETLEDQDPWRAVREALRRKLALVALDGADEWLDLNRWLEVVAGGALLVTTRRGDLGDAASQLRLPPMATGEARELLTRDVRVDVGADDLAWLVETLGGLPLALDIVNRMAWQSRGLAPLLGELREALVPTLHLRQRKEDSLRAAFELSYHRLDDEAAALFRFLGGLPQPFELPAIAHILERTQGVVGRAVRRLGQMGLVDSEPGGRYRMHRLLQQYALDCARECDGPQFAAWERRLAAYYLDATREALALYRQGQERQAQALWHERLSYIDRGFVCAALQDQREAMLEYMQATLHYLGLAGHAEIVRRWREGFGRLAWDDRGRAAGSTYLGEACLFLLQPEQAIPLLSTARELWTVLGDERFWLHTSMLLGKALLATGRSAAALALVDSSDYAQAAGRLAGDGLFGAAAWALSGDVNRVVGQLERARHDYEKAQEALERQPSARHLRERAQLTLAQGELYLGLEEPEHALLLLEDGAQVAEAGGYDLLWGFNVLWARVAEARLGQAEQAAERLAALEERVAGDPRCQSLLALARGEIAWARGAVAEGIAELEAAAGSQVGTPLEVDVLMLLAARLQEHGEDERALALWPRVREHARRLEYRYPVATLEYGRCLWRSGQTTQARPLLVEVVDLAQGEALDDLAAEAWALLRLEEE